MPAPAPAPSTSAPVAAPALVLVPQPDAPAAKPLGWFARRRQAAAGDAGMTTAEYAIGTVAACGFGGVLYKLITSDTVFSLLTKVISRAFRLMF